MMVELLVPQQSLQYVFEDAVDIIIVCVNCIIIVRVELINLSLSYRIRKLSDRSNLMGKHYNNYTVHTNFNTFCRLSNARDCKVCSRINENSQLQSQTARCSRSR